MISLERLFDNSISQRNFDKLSQAVIDTGADPTTGAPRQVGLRFGTGTATFTASTHSANVTVPHGLGRVPANVQLTAYHDIVYEIVSTDATNIVVQGWAPGGATTGTLGFDWLVIG